MAKSSIADRYLRTLETNETENKPKSPPRSLRSPVKAPAILQSPSKGSSISQPGTSPTKLSASPTKWTEPWLKSTEPAATAVTSNDFRSSLRPVGTSPVKSSVKNDTRSSLEPELSKVSSLATNVSTAGHVQPHSTVPVDRAFRPPATRSSKLNYSQPMVNPITPSVVNMPAVRKSLPVVSQSAVADSGVSRLGPPPDRNPTMHNQDLNPSQVSWDHERKNWQTYEYLCHVTEAKEWMEKILGEELPPAENFPESLQNGIALAKIVKVLRPELMKWPVFEHKRLQYRHTENITQFFDLLDALRIPQLFLFDMTDLYEKRNLPKVIYCIHAVSHYIAESEAKVAAVDNLVGKLEFSESQISATERNLNGRTLPNFGAMSRHISGKHSKLEALNDDGSIDRERTATSPVNAILCDSPISHGPGKNSGTSAGTLHSFEATSPTSSAKEFSYEQTDGINSDRSEEDGTTEFESSDREEWAPRRRPQRRRWDYNDNSDYDDDMTTLTPPPRHRFQPQNTRQWYPDSEDEDNSFQELRIRPQRYHNRSHNRDEYSDRVDRFNLSVRKVSRDMYHRSYMQSDFDYNDSSNYRDLSSAASLRTRILTSAERMLMELESLEPEITVFLALCRGALVRKSLRLHQKNEKILPWVTNFQALIRGQKARRFHQSSEVTDPIIINTIVEFQAISRRCLLQKSLKSFRELDDTALESVLMLQAIIRANKTRSFCQLSVLNDSQMRSLVKVQAFARGKLVRTLHQRKKYVTDLQIVSLTNFQSLIRGVKLRKVFRNTTSETANLTLFQSLARGVLTRQRLRACKTQLTNKDATKSIVVLQASFRGILARYKLSCLYDDLDQFIPSIVGLQALCRRSAKKQWFDKQLRSWKSNEDKIVLIQSHWRAVAQGAKYRTLIKGPKPDLAAIRPFLQLIDDKSEDFKLDLELEELLKDISKRVKENEKLEAVIEQLDMKIALLVKNNISIDELVLQQQRQNEKLREEIKRDVANGSSALNFKNPQFQTSSLGLTDPSNCLKEHFDPKSLQKPSRDRIELYQGLLYILQTQPAYISKLMTMKPPRSLDISDLILAIFGNGGSPREMFFLLRQLALSITQSTVGSPENTVAWCIIAHLNRREECAAFAAKVLEPAADKIKAVSDQLLEYDPHLIYEHLTGGGNLSAEEAIQDQAVQAVFVQNLHNLREISMIIVQSIIENIVGFPYHIRFIAREVYREVLRASNDRAEALSTIGQVIISQFIQPALINAGNLDLVDAAIGKTSKNLILVGRVLHQIGRMTPFTAAGGTDAYLQPLNDFVKSRSKQLSQSFLSDITTTPDLQDFYGISELSDVAMHEKPVLSISMNYIFALHYMCYHNENALVAKEDSILKPVLDHLGPLPRDAREMLDLARFKNVSLELNPKYGAALLSEGNTGVASMLATAKRCLGYVLRVQSDMPNVMSVLIAPVEAEDELKYSTLLEENKTREAIGDLAELSFRDLKALTLEIVLELESSGHVSRENDYQVLINAIAEDIRNKDAVRQKRQTDVTVRRETLASVEEKGEYLKNRVKVYTSQINEAMRTLQSEAAKTLNAPKAKRFQKFQFNTSKTLGGVDQNAARYGSYKVSADKLYEKSILIRLRGYSDRARKDIFFNFRSDEVSEFQINVTCKDVLLPNGSIRLNLDELLSYQYRNEPHIEFLSNTIQFSTNRLLQLILTKFFGTSD